MIVLDIYKYIVMDIYKYIVIDMIQVSKYGVFPEKTKNTLKSKTSKETKTSFTKLIFIKDVRILLNGSEF